MKKIGLLVITLLLAQCVSVHAVCDEKELSSKASLIKVKYEVVTKERKVATDDELAYHEENKNLTYKYDVIVTTIYNIPDNVFLVQTNDINSDKKIINSDDINNGVYTFESEDLSQIVRYKYEVYSNVNGCDSSKLRTINFIKPKKNEYSFFEICKENNDVNVCKEYITEDVKVKESELVDYIYKVKNINTTIEQPKENNNIISFIKEHMVYVVIIGVLIIGGVATYVIVSKKRSRL